MWKQTGLLLAFFVLLAPGTMAQTPQDPAFAGHRVTFSSDDLLGAMTAEQRLKFKEQRADLKELQAAGRAAKPGSATRRALVGSFESLKADFEQGFGEFRGFTGKTVMVYGDPPPSKSTIINKVVAGRRGGGTGFLSPHWERTRGGAVIGRSSPPVYESGPAAGPTVTVQVPLKQTRPTNSSSSSASITCLDAAGPKPHNKYPLECFCSDPSEWIYGIPSCWWVKPD